MRNHMIDTAWANNRTLRYSVAHTSIAACIFMAFVGDLIDVGGNPYLEARVRRGTKRPIINGFFKEGEYEFRLAPSEGVIFGACPLL